MHTKSIEPFRHSHTFGQEIPRAGEKRTMVVIIITAVTMAVEITAGIIYGSMALLADGLHMGSHASALAITAFAYFYTRRHAADKRFNFGTGKVNSLAAFASAILLIVFALIMAIESIKRFFSPVPIEFNQAILVAIIGLAVNGFSLLILRGSGHSDSHHGSEHSHSEHHHHAHEKHHHFLKSDHNLWSAYLHILADTLTSLLAILALLAGKYFGQRWLDPFMGLVGAALVTRWSLGLLRTSGHVLLDMKVPAQVNEMIHDAIESESDARISDLHIWAVGPDIYAAEIVIFDSNPKNPQYYSSLLPQDLGIVHSTIQVEKCR
ncbi:MAG: CDF family Co(II)/Ni(II) efflux transporter DmeF [Candidatus Zixiibacteriota bacterium]